MQNLFCCCPQIGQRIRKWFRKQQSHENQQSFITSQQSINSNNINNDQLLSLQQQVSDYSQSFATNLDTNTSNQVSQDILQRYQIKNVKQYPFDCIGLLVWEKYCHVNKKYKNAYGTGFLICSNLVITVAHNLYCSLETNPNKNLKFYPALDGQVSSSQVYEVQQKRVSQKYNPSQISHDFAILKLKKKIERQNYIMVGQDYPQKANVKIYGYPADKNNQDINQIIFHQYGGDGQIKNITQKDQSLSYQINTNSGQSGSPILTQYKSLYFAIGIHGQKSSTSKKRRGSRLTNSKIDQIRKWVGQLQPEAQYIIINFPKIPLLESVHERIGSDIRRYNQIQLFLEQIEMEKKQTDKLRWLYVQLAKKYILIQKKGDAIKYILKAEKICRNLSYNLLRDKKLACILNEKGNLKSNSSQTINEAKQAYEQALSIYRQLNQRHSIGSILTNLGNCYITLKKPQKALVLYEEAEPIIRQQYKQNSNRFSNFCYSKANAFLLLKQYDRACQLYKYVISLKQKSQIQRNEKSQQLSPCYFYLAQCLYYQQQFQEGFGYHYKAIELMIRLELKQSKKYMKYKNDIIEKIQKYKQKLSKQRQMFLIEILQKIHIDNQDNISVLIDELKNKIRDSSTNL